MRWMFGEVEEDEEEENGQTHRQTYASTRSKEDRSDNYRKPCGPQRGPGRMGGGGWAAHAQVINSSPEINQADKRSSMQTN